ncbi:LysR family transcriptional regulator [Terriglobus sp.]|uniref:LysR family transcriptional regulator n=1 Tax=Terriglobus sp. TaxID=1889013 RepID=UPI003AFF8ABC
MRDLEIKHLRAVVTLAEVRHFSRAAARLRIGQSGLTKQIVVVESYLGYPLFLRQSKRVTVTSAGEVFVAEARLALQHVDRAVNLSRAANEPIGLTVHVGRCPYTDPYLITKLLSLRLPLYPNLKVHLSSRLCDELTLDLLDGTLDLAFLSGLSETPRLSGFLIADEPFWIAMPSEDDLAFQREIAPDALQERSCILFERQVQPDLHDAVVRTVRPATKPGCSLHHVLTADDALQLILRGFGIAVLPANSAWRVLGTGITIRPLAVPEVRLRTRLVARADNDSKVIGDVVRSLVRSLRPPDNDQFSLALSR